MANQYALSPAVRAALKKTLGSRGGVDVAGVQHGAGSGLLQRSLGDYNVWDRHPKLAKTLQFGAAAAPFAVLAAPYLASGGGGAASASAPATVGGSTGAGATAASGAAGAGGGSVAGTTAIMDPWYGVAPAATKTSALTKLFTNPDIIAKGIGAGAQLAGAGIESHANTEAAKIQAETYAQALAYEKQRDAYLQGLERQRYGELNARLEPYMAMGRSQGDRLATLLGVNPASYQYGTPAGADSGPGPVDHSTMPGVTRAEYGAIVPSLYSQGSRAQPPGAPTEGTAVPRGTAQTVMMRAPDGSTKAVPSDQVAHFTQRGAQVVG